MRSWGLGKLRAISLGAVALGVLAVPAGASAATVSITGSTLTYSANAGEANDVTIELDAGVFRVIDNTAPATAGAGCNQRAVHRVNCPNAGINLVEVLARDQDDTVLTVIGTTDAHMNGGSGTDSLTSDAGDDVLTAAKSSAQGSGEDLSSGAGADVLNGTTSVNGSDQMFGDVGDDQLIGGPGTDSMIGGTGADDIQGGDGSDFFSAQEGAPTTITLDDVANDGATGENDNVHSDVEEVFGTSFADTMVGDERDQTFFSFGGPDNLQGAGGNDSLNAGDGVDTLQGGGGSDLLTGGLDADDISGGTGQEDEADYSDRSSAVTVTINNNPNDGGGGGAEGDNVRTDVENLRATSDNDTLTGSTDDNRIEGQSGNDTINGIGGDDELFGEFTFNTGTGNDTLNGGNGDDQLVGGPGADDMTGGNDFDFANYSGFSSNPRTITIDNVADDGEAGENDNVRVGIEGVIGGNGPDTITGNSGVNTLQGYIGADTLHGLGGNDLLIGDVCCTFAADDFDGGAGEDTVSYRDHFFPGVTVDIDGVADDGANGTEGDNVETTVEDLIGSDSSDVLTGSGVANTIAGRSGNDTLAGGAGGDTLAGNFGSDTHEGQAGKDEINSRGDNTSDVDNCGTEADVATADAFDTVNADCETVIP